MKKQDISVESLCDMIGRGELQLPEIQRKYVWRSPRVRDLLDSLYRGYPSGSILVWETDQPIPVRDLAVQQIGTSFAGQKLLLDGQQRLTSLAAVMSGQPVKVRGRKKPIEILFNLEHPEGPPLELSEVTTDEESPLDLGSEDVESMGDDEEDESERSPDLQARLNQRTFVVASKSLARRPNWVSVNQVFAGTNDGEILRQAGVKGFDDPRYEKYTQRLQRLRQIRRYMYVMHVLERDLAYEEVAEIFVRVNSLGMKLRSSDLALAQITARWPNSLRLLEEFQAECEEQWFSFDTGLLLRTMIVFATQQAKLQRAGSVRVEELKRAWDQAKEGLRFAVNFLRTNAGIEDESLLSSPMLVIPPAVFSVLRRGKLSREDERQLLYWLLVANARGRYSRGGTEGALGEDLGFLFRGGMPQDLLTPIRRLFGRLHVVPEDLTGRGPRSPLFALAFLALKASGAKDWRSGLGISLTHQGKLHFIEHHHIFPKALLRKVPHEVADINEIANLAFISGGTNRWISNKSPEVYLPEILRERGEEALLAHCIPLDPELHRLENYRQFLETRRATLAQAINRHIEQGLEPLL